MTLRGELKSFIAADAAVSAIVGSRVYWQERNPKEENDTSLVFARTEGPRDYELSGEIGYEVGVWRLELRSQSADTVEALETAVIDLLSGYSGPLGDDYGVHFSLIQDAADFLEPLPDGSNGSLKGIVLFFYMRLVKTEE